jgi:hypothetical protein
MQLQPNEQPSRPLLRVKRTVQLRRRQGKLLSRQRRGPAMRRVKKEVGGVARMTKESAENLIQRQLVVLQRNVQNLKAV